jgi:glycosyltransferase involved in cell wall biosynthesis
MSDATVSVIIPVFNRKLYLPEALASILEQTYQPLEIILIDDGSTDASAEVIKDFPSVRYFYQTNSGAATARNRGVELAQGNFLAFLDSDDLWTKDKLARQMTVLATTPEIDIVFGHVKQFHSPELDQSITQKTRFAAEIMPGYHVGAMLVRREAFFRVGLFETNLKVGEFISWHLRATELGLQMMMLPEVVMQRRIHETNMGIYQRQNRSEYLKVVKAALDRRRVRS